MIPEINNEIRDLRNQIKDLNSQLFLLWELIDMYDIGVIKEEEELINQIKKRIKKI